MIKLNHDLISYKTSKHYFICKKCDNLIHHQFDDWWYYLDLERDIMVPLKDCHEMIIKNLLE